MERGAMLYDQGNYKEAMEAFDQAIALEPWSLETYHYLHAARVELEAKQPLIELDADIAECDELLKDDREDPRVYVRRGRAKYQRTVLSGDPSISEDPLSDVENVTVHGSPFMTYHLNLEHAIADFDQAIELDPDYAEAYHLRGLAHHLQALGYMGIAQLGLDAEEIELAILDYEQAIALDPTITAAYHDRGTAYAQRAWHVGRVADDTPEEVHQDYQRAINDFESAVEQNPDSEETYLNRAFLALMFSSLSGEEEEESADGLQQRLDDSKKIVELNPENMWGYFFRALAYGSAKELAKDESTAALMERQAIEDFDTFDRLGGVLLKRYDLSDLATRILTLSSGPSIDPAPAEPSQLAGTLESDTYTSPDGSFRLQLPELMQPGAVIWDEVASSGDLLVWLEDDLARWYSLQVHPGTLGAQSLEQWARANLSDSLNVQEEYQTDVPLGTAIVLVYRHTEPEADCSTAVVHRDEHFYSASYCLLEHYAGKDEEASIRTFGALFGIEIEPVDAIAEEFIRGLEVLEDSR